MWRHSLCIPGVLKPNRVVILPFLRWNWWTVNNNWSVDKTKLDTSHMVFAICLTSPALELENGTSCGIPAHHFLRHSYHTPSQASAGSFSWVGFFGVSYKLLFMVWTHPAVLLVSHCGLWDDTWKSSALICCAKEDVLLQFFHDSEKQRNLKGHMVVCDLFCGFIQYCHCAFGPTTASQLGWIDSDKVEDLHNSRTSLILNSLASAHQRDKITYGVQIFLLSGSVVILAHLKSV